MDTNESKLNTNHPTESRTMNNNPWFWGNKTRYEFERDLMKDAVALIDDKGKKVAPRKKVDIEAVKARKNALVKSGVIRSTVNSTIRSIK